MKSSRQIYDEIISDATFKAMLNDNIRRTEARIELDLNYISVHRNELIISQENSLFHSSWRAAGYGKFIDEGLFQWIDERWLTSTDERIRDIEERHLKADMQTFLLTYIEVTEYLSEQKPEPEINLESLINISAKRKAEEHGRDILQDIEEYLHRHSTKTEITAMAVFLYNNRCIKDRPRTFSKFLRLFAQAVKVECPDPKRYKPSLPQVRNKVKEIENILYYL